jgi:hypothetical protein
MIKAKDLLITRFFIRQTPVGRLINFAPLGLAPMILEMIDRIEPSTGQRPVAKKEMWKIYFVLPDQLKPAVNSLLPYEKLITKQRAYARPWIDTAWTAGNPKSISTDEMAMLQRALGEGPWCSHYSILLTPSEYEEQGGRLDGGWMAANEAEGAEALTYPRRYRD